MDEPSLSSALDLAERSLDRIERAAIAAKDAHDREAALRDKVQEVVADLDQMIRDVRSR